MKSVSLVFLSFVLGSAAFAGLPVLPAKDQSALLQSTDPALAANKKLVYDFTRIILRGLRLERVAEFMREDYLQHNLNVETGMKGFLEAFSQLGGPRPIPDQVAGLVSMQAEGDMVTMSFVNTIKNADGTTYTTTWFDMFRVEDGKIAEHWDNDTK